jgi:hypothetical protein
MMEKGRAFDLSLFCDVFHSNYHPLCLGTSKQGSSFDLPLSYTSYFENEFQFDCEHNHSINSGDGGLSN